MRTPDLGKFLKAPGQAGGPPALAGRATRTAHPTPTPPAADGTIPQLGTEGSPAPEGGGSRGAGAARRR